VTSAEALATQLVRDAPALDRAVITELTDTLRADGRPLALAIARAVELVDEQLVDPAIALPVVAMACATLRETDPAALAGALFDIETLTPKPDGSPAIIPVSSLKRR